MQNLVVEMHRKEIDEDFVVIYFVCVCMYVHEHCCCHICAHLGRHVDYVPYSHIYSVYETRRYD